MDFSANLKSYGTKPATQDEFDDHGDIKKEARPAVMTIQIVVESPPDNLAALMNRLANDGGQIRVSLSSYQMALSAP
uniref:Uncharacterized protein n=1 Tax=viral metagenome TaxID=1070528 RepID=A0A6H1ZYS1_9ZZZZ